jgi:hypothetical protein
MIYIFIFIGFLLIANMSQRTSRSRRQFFHNDFPSPPYGFNGGYPIYRDTPYFHHEIPYNGQNTYGTSRNNREGGYQQFQREKRQQSLYYTMLFLLGLIAFLIYWHG